MDHFLRQNSKSHSSDSESDEEGERDEDDENDVNNENDENAVDGSFEEDHMENEDLADVAIDSDKDEFVEECSTPSKSSRGRDRIRTKVSFAEEDSPPTKRRKGTKS